PETGAMTGIETGIQSGVQNWGSILGWMDGNYFSGSVDPVSWQVSNIPSNIVASFSPPPANPRFGPAQMAWNGANLQFKYTNNDGADVYADWLNGIQATIDENYNVALGGSYVTNGRYDPNTFQF